MFFCNSIVTLSSTLRRLGAKNPQTGVFLSILKSCLDLCLEKHRVFASVTTLRPQPSEALDKTSKTWFFSIDPKILREQYLF